MTSPKYMRMSAAQITLLKNILKEPPQRKDRHVDGRSGYALVRRGYAFFRRAPASLGYDLIITEDGKRALEEIA